MFQTLLAFSVSPSTHDSRSRCDLRRWSTLLDFPPLRRVQAVTGAHVCPSLAVLLGNPVAYVAEELGPQRWAGYKQHPLPTPA